MKVPCLLCERRTVGCHGKCDEYKAFRTKLDTINEENRADTDVRQYLAEKHAKMKRKFYRERKG